MDEEGNSDDVEDACDEDTALGIREVCCMS